MLCKKNADIFYCMNLKAGFTLIEILIAVSIIAILSLIGVVTYNGIRQKAYDAKVDVTLNQVENAIRIHVKSNNKTIPMKYYSNLLFAQSGPGRIDSGIQVYHGGGIGKELVANKLLNADMEQSLKGGPKHDPSLKDNIKFLTCGKNKVFIVAESYSGVEEAVIQNRMNDLNCAWKNEQAWREEHGLPTNINWGSGSGSYVKPRYKYREIDL